MAENIIKEEVDEYCRLDAVEETSDSIDSDIEDDEDCAAYYRQVEEERKQPAYPNKSAAVSGSKKSVKTYFALKMRLPTVSVVKNTFD